MGVIVWYHCYSRCRHACCCQSIVYSTVQYLQATVYSLFYAYVSFVSSLAQSIVQTKAFSSVTSNVIRFEQPLLNVPARTRCLTLYVMLKKAVVWTRQGPKLAQFWDHTKLNEIIKSMIYWHAKGKIKKCRLLRCYQQPAFCLPRVRPAGNLLMPNKNSRIRTTTS